MCGKCYEINSLVNGKSSRRSDKSRLLGPYLNYILSDSPPNFELEKMCGRECGKVAYAEKEDECSAILEQRYFPSAQYVLTAKRMKNQSEGASFSNQQPSLCIWVFFTMPKNCRACLSQITDIGDSLTMLSRTTALLRTGQASVLKCVHLHSKCHSLRDVPESICTYAKKMKTRQPSQQRRTQTLGFDLNMEPPPEIDVESTSTSTQEHGTPLTSELAVRTSSQSFGTIATVIHFDKEANKMELNLFQCVEYIVVNKEVLLISVHQVYIWLTKKENCLNQLAKCENECSILV